MLHTVLLDAEPVPSEPALPSGSTNLPVIAPNHLPATNEPLTERLIRLLATSYVRNDTHFYHVDRPSEAMSRDNLQRAFLYQAVTLNGGQEIPKQVLKEVFDTAIVQMNPNPCRSIPVWTGSIAPHPGNTERRIQLESGQVVLNSWKEPAYRRYGLIEPWGGPFAILFQQMFPREDERNRVLDWMAWCLQNEGKKPNWAIMLFAEIGSPPDRVSED